MKSNLHSPPIQYFVGLDVHRDTISASVYDADHRRFCEEKTFCAHSPTELSRFVDALKSKYGVFRCCYEASYSGTAFYEAMTDLGADCAIIAPGSIPRSHRDRIKTDRRDSRKLSEYFAAGLLTECYVPDKEWLAARTLSRRRGDLIKELHRSKMRVIHFLHQQGHCYTGGGNWTQKFMTWINQIELDYPSDEFTLQEDLDGIAFLESRIQLIEEQIQATSELPRFQEQVQILQAFRGIGLITAMDLLCEIIDFRRFDHPSSLMAYLGLVPSQNSSGNTIRTGGITKTGNARARKALVSAAWKYMYRPHISVALAERQKKCSPAILAISQRCQKRLHKRFHALNARKSPKVAAVAIARELVGFIWEAMQLPAQTQ